MSISSTAQLDRFVVKANSHDVNGAVKMSDTPKRKRGRSDGAVVEATPPIAVEPRKRRRGRAAEAAIEATFPAPLEAPKQPRKKRERPSPIQNEAPPAAAETVEATPAEVPEEAPKKRRGRPTRAESAAKAAEQQAAAEANAPEVEQERQQAERLDPEIVREMARQQLGGPDIPFAVVDQIRNWLTPEEYIGWLKGTIFARLAQHRQLNGNQDISAAAWFGNNLKSFVENQGIDTKKPVKV